MKRIWVIEIRCDGVWVIDSFNSTRYGAQALARGVREEYKTRIVAYDRVPPKRKK